MYGWFEDRNKGPLVDEDAAVANENGGATRVNGLQDFFSLSLSCY